MLRVVEESLDVLAEYGRISIAHEVRCRLRAEQSGDGWTLTEEPVEVPWFKDESPAYRPSALHQHMRLDNIGVLAAYEDDRRVGGAIVVYDNPDAWFLEGRRDIASCLDLRVDPAMRRRGIGRALIAAMVDWARQRGCTLLKIETQDTNVEACRFYEAMGGKLGEVNLGAYAGSDEVQLV